MLGTVGTTHADLVRLSRAVSPGSRHLSGFGATSSPATSCSRIAGDRIESPVGRDYRSSPSPVRSRVRLCRPVVGRSMPASSAQSCAAWPSVRNWSACSSRRPWLVSAAMVSPNCWTLMVSPSAHRFHSSSGRSVVAGPGPRRECGGARPGCRGGRRPSVPPRRVPAPGCTGRGQAGAVSGLLEVFVGAFVADLGSSDLVASGPSPAPARRVEATLSVGELPPRLIGPLRGSGKSFTSRRGRCLDTGEASSRRGAETASRTRSASASVAACSATVRSLRSSWRNGSNHSGTAHRPGAYGCRHASAGCCWARVRRWVTAGMSARSKARIVSRVSLASATSWCR